MDLTQFYFFDQADKMLFVRSDAEQATWQVDELTLNALFPYDPGKVIERGMRIGFKDAEGVFQPFEVRIAKTYPGDMYQELTCEHIAVSELTDYHTDEAELDHVTPEAALTSILASQPTGITGSARWAIGNVTATDTSSGDIGTGSIWQNVRTIETNWNVYILPRVTFGANGITGRYLDIVPAEGVWRGMRLSLDKNMDEAGVTIDDTEVKTALYGYGGTKYTETQNKLDKTSEKITLAGYTWNNPPEGASKNPADAYIVDTVATAAYGRNGQPRFGFYQNTDITDQATLAQKVWETLQTTNKPAVTVDCIVKDLYRLGYHDEPIRLHDTVLVEIKPVNQIIQLAVVKLSVDLLDPTATRPTIGKYIPNIIYIQRDTSEHATGGANRSISGRRGEETEEEAEWSEFVAEFTVNNRIFSYHASQIDRDNNILQAAGMDITAEGAIIYAEDNVNMIGSKFTQTAGRIDQEIIDRSSADRTLQSNISQEANKISLIVQNVGADGTVTAASVVTAINDDGTSGVKIEADHIQITGDTGIAGALEVAGFLMADEIFSAGGISSNETVYADAFSGNSATISGDIECETVTASGAVDALILYADESVEAPVINADTYAGYQVNGVSIGLGNALRTITITPPASGSSTYTLTGTTLDGSSVSIGTIDSGGTSSGLVNATVANNVLTITKSDGTYVNFSKATTLTGAWGSGSKAGTYIVNATQTNINTSTGQPETTNVGSWDIRFGDTIGGADVALNAVIGTGNPDATGSNIIFPVNIGTATSGTMTTQVSLTRSVNCEAVRGMATSNALTVESQTDAQWADLTDVTDISSSITGGGKYLITATPKYGTPVKQKFVAPSGGGNVDVVKGAWTYAGIGTIYQTSTCEFYPSSGNGAHQYVEIQQDIYIPESLTYSGSLYFKDNYSNSIVGSGRFYLQQHENFVFATINNDPVSLENAIARLAITGSGTQRSVSSLSQVVLNANHTTSTQYPVTVTYDNNTTGSSTITVDASAISGGGGSDDRVVASLAPNPIVLTSSQTQTSSHTLTAHYSTGSDSTIAVSIDASAVYAEGMSVGSDVDIQSGRVINITTNNTSNTYYATGAYDAMSSVIVNVNIPDIGGTITDITAPSIAGNQLVSNVTLTASGTNVAAPYTETVTLANGTYYVGSIARDCVTLSIDGNTIGRIGTGFQKTTVTLISGAPTQVTPAITSSAFRLTGAGYRRLFYYSDTEDRYIDAAVDGRAHYWYYSSSHVNTGDYAPMGTYTQYYPMSSVYTDTDTYYTKDS